MRTGNQRSESGVPTFRGDGGLFSARSGEDYCWMWVARDKPAKIEGRIEAK